MSLRLRTLAAAGLLAGTVVVLNPLPASAASFMVNITSDSVDADTTDGICVDAANNCSLRAAVQQANATPGPDIISLDDGLEYLLTIAGPGEDVAATGDLDITSDITINSPTGSSQIRNQADDRILHVQAGAALVLNDVATFGGTANDAPSAAGGGSGGAVLNAGSFRAVNSPLITNRAVRAGGAIEASPGSTTFLQDSSMQVNSTGSAPGNGGGVHVTGAASVTIVGGTHLRNSATNEGGAFWNSATGTMSVTDASLNVNTAGGAASTSGGGGIFNQPNATNTGGGTLTITDTNFISNVATGAAGSGGGIFNGGTAAIGGYSQIVTNTATRAGGGIEAAPGSVTTMNRGTLAGNEAGPAPGNGGGLHITGNARADLTGVFVRFNTAASEGGGLWNSATGTLTVNDGGVSENVAAGAAADNGGGGIFNDGGTLAVLDGSVDANQATGLLGSGGGIFNGGTATVTDTEIKDNSAVRAGGGIESLGAANTTITGSTLLNNKAFNEVFAPLAPGNGGGMHVTGPGTTNISESFVTGNTAGNEGGGLWNSATGTMTVTTTDVSTNDTTSLGGGLYNDGGTLLAQNSLVHDNLAADGGGGDHGGGVHAANGGSTTLQHVTVVANTASTGSGVSADSDSTITLNNSIVSANTRGDDCDGTIATTGGNLTGACTVAGPGDVTGVADPMLNASFVPQPGSPAIDGAIQANSLPTDYTGTARPLDGDGDGTAVSDSGAVEAPGDTTSTTTSTTSTSTTSTTIPGDTTSTSTPGDTVTSTSTPGDTTSTSTPGDTVTVNNGNQGNGGVSGNNGNPGVNNGALPRTGSNTNSLVLLGLSLLTMGAIVLVLRNRGRLALAPTKR